MIHFETLIADHDRDLADAIAGVANGRLAADTDLKVAINVHRESAGIDVHIYRATTDFGAIYVDAITIPRGMTLVGDSLSRAGDLVSAEVRRRILGVGEPSA